MSALQLASMAALAVGVFWRARRRRQAENENITYKTVMVRPEHYQDILELARHTYGGHDYIVGEFHSWFKIGCIVLGIEAHDQKSGSGPLVSLLVMRPIKQDRVGYTEALRVHPKHRGKGLAKRIVSEMIELVKAKKHEIGVDKFRYTVEDENVASVKIALHFGFEVRHKFPFMMIAEDEDVSDPLLAEYLIGRNGKGAITRFRTEVREIYESLLGESISSHSTPRKLDSAEEILEHLQNSVKTTVFFQGWKPYDVTLENIALVLDKGHEGFVFDPHGCSLGLFREDHHGEICILTCYWDESWPALDATRDFLKHLMFWLDHCEKEAGLKSIYFCFPSSVQSELMKAGLLITKPTNELILELEL